MDFDLAISGTTLPTFIKIHLFQFRFADTYDIMVCPPKYFLNLETLLEFRLNLFWVGYEGAG